MYKLMASFLFVFFLHNDNSYYTWNENEKLEWRDFKGQPNDNADAVAVTASGITFSYSIEKSSTRGIVGFNTEVFAHFYPEHSWCKEELINDYILTHEQLHFDITELNVRYMREKIGRLKVSPSIATILDDYNEKAKEELKKMQKKYDSESNFSINKEGQAKWAAYIKAELDRLKDYKSN